MCEFISIISNDLGGDSPNNTKKIFDKEFKDDFNEIYRYSTLNSQNNQVFITKNQYNCVPIISGINEKYMINHNDNYSSKLKIIYFSNYHDLDNYDSKNSSMSILGGLMGISKTLFDEHKLTIKPEQIILFGLNDIDYDIDLEGLNNMNIEYYTLSQIKKKGSEIIINKILENNQNVPLLAYFNLEVFNIKIAPSVKRRKLEINDDLLNDETTYNRIDDGLDFTQLENISQLFKNKIKYLLISGYDNTLDNKTGFFSRMTSEVVQILYRNIMDIKEKKLNVFNENSRFLIFRKLKQESEEDIGWYILRFLTIDERIKVLESIEDEKIYTINLSDYGIEDINDDIQDELLDDEILISATNIADQNIKSYYLSKSIVDCALYPQEKFLMGFELVN